MIELPASANVVLAEAVNPALQLLPAKMGSDSARVQILADGLYESGFRTRKQLGGPAHGLWQFEPNGIRAVMHHNTTGNDLLLACQKLGVKFGSTMIYFGLLDHDILAAILARLLMWADPQPLPAIGDELEAWACHVRVYRPGRPDPERFSSIYPMAVAAVKGV